PVRPDPDHRRRRDRQVVPACLGGQAVRQAIVAERGSSGAAWGSLVAGLASCATLPLAVYVSRFSDTYDLIHAAFVIPVAVALAFVALALARRARARGRISLSGGGGGARAATAGRIL